MTKLPLYQVRDMAVTSGRLVFDVQQLANLIGKPRPVARVYSSRLVERGMAQRLMRGRISFTENEFIIASQLYEPSYISLDSALLYHHVKEQIPKNVQCVYPGNSIKLNDLGIVYHKIPHKMFFGYRRYGTEGSYIMVADAEKALLDGYYLGTFSLNQLAEYSSGLNFRDYRQSLSRFNGKGSKKLLEAISFLIRKR